MNFIRVIENAVDKELCERVLNKGVDTPSEVELTLATLDLVGRYIELNRESNPSHYYYHKSKIIKFKDRFDTVRCNDNEVLKINDQIYVRNFSVLVCLEDIQSELYFPFQNANVQFKKGSLVMFPASFMCPYEASEVSEGSILEMEYYFKKELIIGTEMNRSIQYVL